MWKQSHDAEEEGEMRNSTEQNTHLKGCKSIQNNPERFTRQNRAMQEQSKQRKSLKIPFKFKSGAEIC
jgi:hypothetical protein